MAFAGGMMMGAPSAMRADATPQRDPISIPVALNRDSRTSLHQDGRMV